MKMSGLLDTDIDAESGQQRTNMRLAMGSTDVYNPRTTYIAKSP